MPVDIIVVGPLQDRPAGELCPVVADNAGGLAVDSASASSLRATRAPDMDVSAIRQRFSRQQSSFTARMRNRREAPNMSDRKSSDHL